MSSLQQAFRYANWAHRDQFRKDGITPYIVHPIEVMRLLQRCGCVDEVTLQIALLHDTVEDTSVTHMDIYHEFGRTVAEAVDRLTLPVGGNKEEFIQTFADYGRSQQAVLMVKAADRICNTRDFADAGDYIYAHKYLVVKGAPIFKGLMGISCSPLAKRLVWEWLDLEERINDFLPND